MNQKKITDALIDASNLILKSRLLSEKPSASYMQLKMEYIQQRADEINVSFEEMVEILESKLGPGE